MSRLPDWEERLAAYLGDRATKARFGFDHARDPDQDDCCTFSGGAVMAMTGVDPMAEFRGRYRSAAGSVRALREIGGGTLEATLDGKFGQVPPAFAQRGDLVLADGMVGVSIGAEALFIGRDEGAAADGLVRIDRADWTTGWAI